MIDGKYRILVVIAVLAVVILHPRAAMAEPNTAAGKLAEYKRLTVQVEKVNENLLKARVDLDKKTQQLRKANDDLTIANDTLKQTKATKAQYQTSLDQLVLSVNQGAQFSRISAFLTGDSPSDFLTRMSALDVLAQDRNRTVSQMTTAISLAAASRDMAARSKNTINDATKAAQSLVATIKKTKTDLDAQIERVHNAYNRLSGANKSALAGGVDNSIFLGGPGAGGKAAEIAMAQRGKPYVWGAAGPDSFDCSGLVLYAYAAAGISLPHSSAAQYGYGVAVTGEFKQGDLLFYGNPIHHVTMYVGDGMLVHASTQGVPVKTDVAPYGGGSDYIGARRLAP